MISPLKRYLDATIEAARIEREEAGRSERGRAASIVVTKLEEIDALVFYYGLGVESSREDDPE